MIDSVSILISLGDDAGKRRSSRSISISGFAGRGWWFERAFQIDARDRRKVRSVLIMKQNVQERTADEKIISNFVAYKPQLPESVHEKADSRPCRPNHLCQGFLFQARDGHLGYALFAELSHQEKNAGQPLFAGIEQLIHQIVLIPDIALQQALEKQRRQLWLQPQGIHHRLPSHVEKEAIRHGNCRRHADGLTGKATFAKEIPFTQDAERRFPSGFRHNCELHLPFLDKKEAIR